MEAFISDAELAVAAVWSSILGLAHISRHDNFFRIGGDSLAALRSVRELWLVHVVGGEASLEGCTNEYGDIDSVLCPASLAQEPVLSAFAALLENHGLRFRNPDHPLPDQIQTSSERLREAALAGDLENVHLLLASGADPDGGVTKRLPGVTPLHLAGCPEVAQALVQSRAKLTLRTPGGVLPVHLAAARCTDVLQMLLEANAPVLAQDANGQRPLHHAARANNPESIRVLVDSGSPLDSLDRWNRAPVHWAVLNDHIEALETLLVLGAAKMPYDEKHLDKLRNVQGRSTHLPLETPAQMAERLYGQDSPKCVLLRESDD